MVIRGIDNRTREDLERELAEGGRFVFYEYCISLILITLRRPSDVYFLSAADQGIMRGLPYCLISFLLGWWGIPFGLVYTPATLFTNLCGGRELSGEQTALVLALVPPAEDEDTRVEPCDEA